MFLLIGFQTCLDGQMNFSQQEPKPIEISIFVNSSKVLAVEFYKIKSYMLLFVNDNNDK